MAEQDRYSAYLSSKDPNSRTKTANVGIPNMNRTSGAEQDRYGQHFSLSGSTTSPSATIAGIRVTDATAIGIFQSALLPSLGFHSGLAITAYVASRVADRAEGKDWLWPSGQVAHAWWSAIGIPVVYGGLTVPAAWATVSYPERVLLTGITIWGTRQFYRVASSSIKRGKDDPRYEVAKKQDGFWNREFVSKFLPEAVLQAVISLPFTLPFRDQHASALASPHLYHADLWHSVAVGVFSAGMALEVLADAQVAAKQKNSLNDTLPTEGVWSIVRNPNYLGDSLIHASFPILLYSTGIMHPLTLLGPIANYVFMRYIRGDKDIEADQEAKLLREDPNNYAILQTRKAEKNSFWPNVKELGNPWTLVVLGAGIGGAVVENLVKNYF